MKLKLTIEEFDYLFINFNKFKYYLDLNEVSILNKNNKKIEIEFNDDIYFKLDEWLSDKNDTKGFDNDYNLNKEGLILQDILDKLNIMDNR